MVLSAGFAAAPFGDGALRLITRPDGPQPGLAFWTFRTVNAIWGQLFSVVASCPPCRPQTVEAVKERRRGKVPRFTEN